MSDRTLEQLISSYMQTSQPQYVFAWQGGEPTLMGVDFYRRVIQLQKKYGFHGARVSNHLQTNAVCIDSDLARHLRQYNFLVGVSLDGPAKIHDLYRTFQNGKGSHAHVIESLKTLSAFHVDTNILTLVSSANVRKGIEIYNYLLENGIVYHQYIPCVEFDSQGKLMPYALRPEDWGEFLCTVFDQWVKSGPTRVSVRYFDALLHSFLSGEYILCHMDKNCGQYFVVEHNGDIYPCDFFVENELRLGNVFNDSWHDIRRGSEYTQFRMKKADWHSDCSQCRYLALCHADCLKYRYKNGVQAPRHKSWLCLGYRRFFEHALPQLKKMAQVIQRQQIGHQTKNLHKVQSHKPGRNEPCPCGSAKKYKKCCGRTQ